MRHLMNNYRIAIIGLGGMGGHHAEAVQLEANCELVAGAEIDPERAAAWGERFGVKAIYDDYEKMLDEQQPDLVIVPTQAPMHHQPTIAAAQRGIHVFCEKPIALNLIEADEMVATCDQHGVKFAINHIKRASPYNRHALSLIDQGAIGQVVLLQATDKGGRKVGNSLMEMGTHLYDWVRLFGGDVEWTHAHLVQMDGRESTVDDIKHTQEVHPKDRDAGIVLGERGHASFRFANGIHADVQFLAQPQTNDNGYGIDIIGTEGRIAVRESVGTTMFIHKDNTRRQPRRGNPCICQPKTSTSKAIHAIGHPYACSCSASCCATSSPPLRKTGIRLPAAETVGIVLK